MTRDGILFLDGDPNEPLPVPSFRRRGRRPQRTASGRPSDLPLSLSALRLDPASAVPLYQQLQDGLRAAIRAGDLPSGTRMPTIRAFAAAFGLGRNTVLAAYQRLTDEGLLNAHVGRGTEVAATGLSASPAPILPSSAPVEAALSRAGRAWLSRETRAPSLGAFALNAPDPSLAPRNVFGRYLSEEARTQSARDQQFEADGGSPHLRQAAADLLRQMRGVHCTANEVLITSSFAASSELCARLLLETGHTAALEDPCDEHGADAFAAAGAHTLYHRFDTLDGLDGVRLAVVSPECQPILGTQMSEGMREQIAAWLERRGAYVLETDDNWPFVFDSPLRRALQPRARGRVIYSCQLHNVVGQNLKVGVLVVPPQLAAAFRAGSVRMQVQPPMFVQNAVARFLNDGHFLSHIRRVRPAYSTRRMLLIAACRRAFPEATPMPAVGGLNLALRLPSRLQEEAICGPAVAAGLGPVPLSRFSHTDETLAGLLLGFGPVPNAQIESLVQRVATASAALGRASGPLNAA